MGTTKGLLLVQAPSRDRASIVDEYGELCRELDAFKPKIDRKEALGREIRGWYDSASPHVAYIETGSNFEVQISPRSNERKVTSWSKVFKILGKVEFLKWATITLKDLDPLIPPHLKHEVIREEQTGRRTLKPVAKASMSKAA